MHHIPEIRQYSTVVSSPPAKASGSLSQVHFLALAWAALRQLSNQISGLWYTKQEHADRALGLGTKAMKGKPLETEREDFAFVLCCFQPLVWVVYQEDIFCTMKYFKRNTFSCINAFVFFPVSVNFLVKKMFKNSLKVKKQERKIKQENTSLLGNNLYYTVLISSCQFLRDASIMAAVNCFIKGWAVRKTLV